MNARERIARLLLDNPNIWISTEELRTVGGDDAPRRVRELRDSGMAIENRRLADGGAEYRLRVVDTHASPLRQRDTQTAFVAPCPKCFRNIVWERSLDARYKLAKCGKCGPVQLDVRKL